MRFLRNIFQTKTISEFWMLCLAFMGVAFLIVAVGIHNFAWLGAVFLAIALCLFPITRLQKKKLDTLLKTGKRTYADVSRTAHYRFMSGIGSVETTIKPTPYRIFYEYEYNGQQYRGYSFLLWKCPNLSRGERVPIIVNENSPKNSCLDIVFLERK